MAKKQTSKKSSTLEEVLTLSGITLIVLGCIANIYSVSVNERFIHDPIFDIIYYFRYILLLGGGFVIGYLLTKRTPGSTKYTPLFNGVFYAAFAALSYELLDAVRITFQGHIGVMAYPWGKIFFLGVPVATLVITWCIAYLARRSNTPLLNIITKRLIIAAFTLDQIYLFVNSLTTFDESASAWPLIVNYLLAPITVAGLTYLLLPRINNTTERALFAVLIATFYSILGGVLWLFRTDPSAEATSRFTIITALITIALTTILIWRVRKAAQ